MIKNKIIILIISLSLFMPSTIYADCTKEEINNFKKIEDDYKITYEFNKETKLYTLTFYSPNPELYDFTIDESFLPNCTEIDNTTINCSNIYYGDYNFEVVGVTEECNMSFKKIKLSLPKYNKYSEDPLCEGIEEFVLCQPTYDKDIDYDTFVSRVNSYKKNHQKIENDKEIKEEVKEQNEIIKYIKDNLFQIIIITIFIILVIITIILTAKSIKKSRRLE